MTGLATVDVGRAAIRSACWELAAGRPVVLVDDDHAHLVLAAEDAAPAQLAFVVRHTSGLVQVAMTAADCDRLDLPLLVRDPGPSRAPDLCVSVDAAAGVTTGISATDRARTIAQLASRSTQPSDLTRPGHVLPVRVHADGVRGRAAVAEAAVELLRAASMAPAAACAALVSERRPCELADAGDALRFATRHALALVHVRQVVAWAATHRGTVERVVQARLPIRAGQLQAVGYRGIADGAEHVALVAGSVSGACAVPVFVHRECLLADVFGSASCECHARLTSALAALGGTGVVVYIRSRTALTGCGLRGRAGKDSVDAATAVALDILRDLEVSSVVPMPGCVGAAAISAQLRPGRYDRPWTAWQQAN